MELVLVSAFAAIVLREASIYPFSKNSFLALSRMRSYTPSICLAKISPPIPIFYLFETVFHNDVIIAPTLLRVNTHFPKLTDEHSYRNKQYNDICDERRTEHTMNTKSCNMGHDHGRRNIKDDLTQ